MSLDYSKNCRYDRSSQVKKKAIEHSVISRDFDLFSSCEEVFFESNSIIKCPSPTLLFAVRPFGVATPYCEALNTYFLRLADSHCISPHNLYKYVLSPLLAKHSSTWNTANAWRQEKISSYCGFGSMANSWRVVLTEVTGLNVLSYCTLYSLNNLISACGLFSNNVRFCPFCIQNTENYKKFYNRLLWTISVVEACPIHKTTLVEHSCGSSHRLLLCERKILFGVCARCGSIGYKCNTSSPFKASETQLWRARQIGELIACLPSADKVFSTDSVLTGMNTIVKSLGEGSIKAAAKRAGLCYYTLCARLKGDITTSLNSLLSLCEAADASLVSVMKGFPESDGLLSRDIRTKAKAMSVKPTKKEKEQALQKALKEKPPLSVTAVAKALGICRTNLTRYFPSLCTRITKAHQNHVMQELNLRRNLAITKCSAIILSLKTQGKPLSDKNFQIETGKRAQAHDMYFQVFKQLREKERQ